MAKSKYFYEVTITTEYANGLVDTLKDQYTKWFETQKKAIAYARSIKKELKEICKIKARKYDIFCLDIIQYWIQDEEEPYLYEDMIGVIYSINLFGKY